MGELLTSEKGDTKKFKYHTVVFIPYHTVPYKVHTINIFYFFLVQMHLSCEIKEKTAIEKANEAPIFKLKKIPEVTKSWRAYQQQLMREDIVRNVCQLSDGP